MALLKNSLLAAVALSQLVSPANAQNSTRQCSTTLEDINDGTNPVNSSRTTYFDVGGDDPWYLSVVLRAPYTNDKRDLQSDFLISVPEDLIGTKEGNDTRICMHITSGQNKVSNADDDAEMDDTCDGVLSDKCQDALRKVATGPSDDECPDMFSSTLKDDCGDARPSFQTTNPTNLSSSACAIADYPHIDVPEGYKTFMFLGIGGGEADKDFYDSYDLAVRQSSPVVLNIKSGDDDEYKRFVGCVAPDGVTDGSREPEADFPPSAAGRVGSWASFVSAMAVPLLVVFAV